MGRGRRSRDLARGGFLRRVGDPERRSSGGPKDLRRRGGVFSWKGWAGEEDQDTGVGVKKRVDEDTGDETLAGAKDSGQSGTEEGEGDKSRGVKVDRAEGKGGKPLGLRDGKSVRKPREESAAKEDLLPYGGDDQSIGKKGEQGFGVAGFQESGHRRLGFEGKAEKKKEARAEEEKKKNWEKKGKNGPESQSEVLDGGWTMKSPERDGFLTR